MKKRIVSIVLTLAMLVGIMSTLPITIGSAPEAWDGTVASAFAGGDGTDDNPYQIATAAQLAYFSKVVNTSYTNYANYISKSYILTADIVLNTGDYTSWTDGMTDKKMLTPIGAEGNGFQGTFDGRGYSVSGFYCYMEQGVQVTAVPYNYTNLSTGFFTTLNGATIKNFALLNSYISRPAGSPIGGLVGYMNGNKGTVTIDSVYVQAAVKGSTETAGFVGQHNNGTVIIKNSVFEGSATATTTTSGKAGGFVGSNKAVLTIEDCLNLGIITGGTTSSNSSSGGYASGFVGYRDGSNTFKLINCINAPSSMPSAAKNSELVGYRSTSYTSNASVTDCISTFDSNSAIQNDKSTYKNTVANNTTKLYTKALDETCTDGTIDTLIGDVAFKFSTTNNGAVETFVEDWHVRSGDVVIPKGVAQFAPGFKVAQATKYTVTWSIDGTTSTENYVAGSTPNWKGTTPTKASDEYYDYSFNGWSPAISAVTNDVTYTVQWTETSLFTPFTNGDGSAEDPYQIADYNDFMDFAKLISDNHEGAPAGAYSQYCGAHYKLMADITVTGDWSPIGTYGKPFIGTLDGNGHKISGINIVTIEGLNAGYGLFNTLSDGAVIKNLIIDSATIDTTKGWAGTIAGQIGNVDRNGDGNVDSVTIQNVYVKADISAASDCGGIIGAIDEGKSTVLNIYNCVFDGSVTITGNYASNIIGSINDGTVDIQNCLGLGTLSGNRLGGIASGSAAAGSSIEKCVSISSGEKAISYGVANITFTDNYALVQQKNGETVVAEKTTYAAMIGSSAALADTLGWTKRANDIMIPTGLATAGVVAPAYYAASYDVTWNIEGVETTQTYDTGEVPTYDGTPTKAEDDKNTYEFIGWTPTIDAVHGNITYTAEFKANSKFAPFASGTGTDDDPYIISSLEEFMSFAQLVSGTHTDMTTGSYDAYGDKAYKLTADIALTGDWSPIGTYSNPFTGILNGDGHKISNINIVTIEGLNAGYGLFNTLSDGAKVMNLIIDNATIDTSKSWAGIIAGQIGNQDINADNTITSVEVNNVYVNANVSAASDCGGILGAVDGTKNTTIKVYNCVFNGSVTVTGNYAGGIFGNLNDGKVDMRDCLNVGTVQGNYSAGVMSGQAYSGTTLQRCVSLTKGTKYVTYYNSNIKQTNCYAVTTSNVNESGTKAVMPEQFMGTEVWNILDTHGWFQRSDDLPVPCEYAESLALYTTYGALVNGASVRLAADVGIRFAGYVSMDWMTAKGYAGIGVLIAPTDKITGDFTATALGSGNYVEIDVTKYQNTPDDDGYYYFTAALAAVKEANLGRDFSARLYFKDASGNIVVYGDYSEENNSRSVKYVAGKAVEDLSKTETSEYCFETMGVYSPYNVQQRIVLNKLAQATEVRAMSYNICAEEVDDRYNDIVAYINELALDKDVIGLQEYNQNWKDAGLSTAIEGFTLAEGTDEMRASGNQFDTTWKIGCPIFYRTDTYNLVDSGFKYFEGRMSWVVLEHKITGVRFIYVNIHTSADSSAISKQDLTDMVNYVNTDVRVNDYAELPAIIGGDTNVNARDDYKTAIGSTNNGAGNSNPEVGGTYKYAQDNTMIRTKQNDPTKVTLDNTVGTNGYSSGRYVGQLNNAMLDRFCVTSDSMVTKSYTPYATDETGENSPTDAEFISDHVPLMMYAIVK